MANVIPDLWPDEILRVQAGQLRVKTKGLVEAEIKTETSAGLEHHYFDIIAPALNRYRYRLLDAWHNPMQVYPVSLWADQWSSPERADAPRVCASQQELLHALGDLFRSSDTRSIISSIIAQSNDVRTASGPAAKE